MRLIQSERRLCLRSTYLALRTYHYELEIVYILLRNRLSPITMHVAAAAVAADPWDFVQPLASPRQCSPCHGFQVPQLPVPVSPEVKYLGVFLDSLSTNIKNTSHRVSQAVNASKLLRPLLSHSSFPPSWKLTAYRSIVQSILMYAMDSAQITPPQLTKLNSVHLKSIRCIFKIKSLFYHRVLNPSAADCSHQYLAGLAFSSRQVITPSQLHSQNRLTILGHLFRHPASLEYEATIDG